MAKRKKKQARNNNWIQLKSAIWKEFKEEGLYDWNSKKFNSLVTNVYEATGKKNPNKIPQLAAIAAGAQQEIIASDLDQAYQISYYELGRTLESLRDNDDYNGYTVITEFNTAEFVDEKFKIQNFEYEGSQFQQLVRAADASRRGANTGSPPPKITVDINSRKRTIKLYVGEPRTGAEPTVSTPNQRAYKEIQKTPGAIKKLKQSIPDNEARIKDIEKSIKLEKEFLIPTFREFPDLFKDSIQDSASRLKEWLREVKQLKKDNEDLKKKLAKTKSGYSAKKKKRK